MPSEISVVWSSKRPLFAWPRQIRKSNRLGGNSLSDLLVFGKRAGEYAAKCAKENTAGTIDGRRVEAIARAALERKESRGAHARLDHPGKDEAFGKQTIVIRRGRQGGLQVSQEPLPEIPAELRKIIDEMKLRRSHGDGHESRRMFCCALRAGRARLGLFVLSAPASPTDVEHDPSQSCGPGSNIGRACMGRR